MHGDHLIGLLYFLYSRKKQGIMWQYRTECVPNIIRWGKTFRNVEWCAWIGPKLWQMSLQIRHCYYEVLVTLFCLSQVNVPFLKTLRLIISSIVLIIHGFHASLWSCSLGLVFSVKHWSFCDLFSTDIPSCFVGDTSQSLFHSASCLYVYSTHMRIHVFQFWFF